MFAVGPIGHTEVMETISHGKDDGPGTDDFLRRFLNLLARYPTELRAGNGDTTSLEHLAAIERALDLRTAEVVHELRAQGYSWQEIGDAYGMTASAARKRWIVRPGVADAPTARKAGGQPAHLR